MELHLSKSEKLISVIALSSASAFILMFMQINFKSSQSQSQIDSHRQINYAMARPEESFSEYSLNGREIDHVYEGLKKKEIAKALESNTKKPQTEEQKKAALAKTKTNDAKKAVAQNTKAVQVKGASGLANLNQTESETKKSTLSHSEPNFIAQTVNGPQNSAVSSEPIVSENKAKAKKTFAEWRTLIFAQPTRENMNLFLEALRKNEVTSTEFQALAQDLLDQNDDKLKGLGLYALRANPSLASLSQLVHIEAEVNASFKAYIEQAYLAYFQTQNISYLNQALQTKDKTLILKSLNLLGANLQKLSKGDYTSLIDPRNMRDSSNPTQFSMNPFKGLLPVLSSIVASQDPELASLAQQVAGYIQTTNNIASN